MKLFGENENPFRDAWLSKYKRQSPEVRVHLDHLEKIDWRTIQLRVIKRKRSQIQAGDVFVFSPRENVYFYGKVLNADFTSNSVEHSNLIFLFKCKTNSTSMDHYHPDYDDLLVPPMIVYKAYWTSGFFFTIANTGISEEEQKLDYGFYDATRGTIKKEDDTILDHVPKILGAYGISTMYAVAYRIESEFVINPQLLL